ncbi:helix-turn-helix transcriptional regulator [Catellatospora coxensis]|uniref:Helix-turn-helix transcriptional regulator n=1 Tax=Catellatospora coxensis TaxID=310354 RepID=A0A8J3KXU1_9ACTN|nr:AAA family ATPase [Catellatospora coxensis]GIG03985.1 helix-turn-helix transcriptional regulator [Catellatospora coxensis]
MGVSAAGTRIGLRGRGRELAELDRALAAARAGTSAVLVLRGEAGIGKTTLLKYAEEHAAGFGVTGAMGVETEMALPYAGLHQLCTPLLGRLPLLPGPQRDALAAALGLHEGPPPNPFLVGLAALTLLARAADERPLACLLDDVQWLDEQSLQAIAFVARRLAAEPIAMILTLRSPGDRGELADLPALTVPGLNDTDARGLLTSAAHVPFDPRVRDRIVAEAHGNPMALLLIPRLVPPAELAGGLWLAGRRPVAEDLEDAFRLRFRQLPADTRRLLLTAAAEPTGDTDLLWKAAELQHLGAEAAAPAETAGLITFDTVVRFPHPLARSAIYQNASAPERRAAHRALAQATDPHQDPDRRAWHAGQAATRPDEALAADLEVCARRAHRRGGAAAAAAFMHRSAQLTPDPARRAARALAAAQTSIDAGGLAQAHAMLAAAADGPLDEPHLAQLERLRARLVFLQERGTDAPRMLVEAARRMAPLDPALARDTLLESLGADLYAGRLNTGPGRLDIAQAIRATPAPSPPRTVDVLLDAVATMIIDGYHTGAGPLRQALRTVQDDQRSATTGADLRWMWLACPVTPEPLAPELWDDDAWHELATGAVHLARDAGALALLPMALSYEACYRVHTGDFATATALADEASAISTATGTAPMAYPALVLSAWRAHEPRARRLLDAVRGDAGDRGEGRALAIADYAAAVLDNGLARYDDALAGATRAGQYEDLGLFGWTLVELIEAAAHSGHPQAAATALDRLTERTRAAATEWAKGIEARSRALLTDGPDADTLYRQAIKHLDRCRITVHQGRARLVYGEWLRRQGRRGLARDQLRAAYDTLTRAGADGFAERARKELLATGETVRRRSVSALAELTGQEAQVAQLAREGCTNVEIAGRLFISPRTVEWHLGKVFTKLGITSRKDLQAAFSAHPGDGVRPTGTR